MIVYTGGTFDLLHSGHIDLLRVCKQLSGSLAFGTSSAKVVVALNTDEFVLRYKGKKPVCSFDERREMLESCRFVDQVVMNIGDEDSKVSIQKVNPGFIVIGDDWAVKDYYKQMGFTKEWLRSNGINLIYVARLYHLSSTAIKERVTDGLMGTNSVSA